MSQIIEYTMEKSKEQIMTAGGKRKNATERFENFISYIAEKLFLLSSIILGIMSIPIVIDVVLRFLIDKTIPGVIELEEFGLVLLVYGAIGYMQINKDHIAIDILVRRFPDWVQKLLDSFVLLISTILFAVLSYQSILNAFDVTDEVSFQLGIPISYFVAFVGIGTGLMAVCLLFDWIKSLNSIIDAGKIRWIWIPVVATFLLLCLPFLVEFSSVELGGFSLGLLGMALLFVLIFLKMPVAFAMFLVGFLGLWTLNDNLEGSLTMLGSIPYAEVGSWIMVVAPLFILMGELAYFSGMSQDLFDAAYKWFGRFPGGLCISSIAGCAGFSAVCGDSLSTAVTMGSIALPEMEKKNYSKSLATGAIAAGGTLGILIPPSVGFIFYALVTETSIGRLFIAGIIPGLLLTSLFILTIYLKATRNPEMAPAGEVTTFTEKLKALKGIIAMLALLILILGGILAGLFSPTEGGAVGAVGAFFYALSRRRLSLANLKKACQETVLITTKLLFIVAGVGMLGAFLASTRLPFEIADLVTGIGVNRYLVLAAIVVFYILLGCALNVIAVILITLPAIFPTVVALGFDPIWFGVISVLLMEMGQITPPIGIIVFAVSSVAKDVPMEEIFKGILPFTGCIVVCVLLLTLFPQIALFLPNLLFN